MKLKSYFAETVEAALSQARRELGEDAMLVNSQRTSVEFRHLGEYEVVCVVTPGAESSRGLDFAGSARDPRGQPLERLSQDVSELRQQMERLAVTLARSSAGMSNIAASPALAKIFASLTGCELDSDLAYDIVLRLGPQTPDDFVRAELGRVVSVDPTLGAPNSMNRIVALVGPPGVGKTTSLVKLAAQFGVASRRPCHILTVDTHRIAAAEQLRSYAAILGVGFQVLETTAALAQALDELQQKDLILIDTPGLSRAEVDDWGEMAHFLATHTGIDTHLVLPASMRSEDLRRTIDRFEAFGPRKLLFTKLDETETFGPIVNQSVRTGKPVSFLSRGQQIPDDLELASKDGILALILKPARSADAARAPGMGAVAAA